MNIGTTIKFAAVASAILIAPLAKAEQEATSAPSWTTNETERFWAEVASVANRLVTTPRMDRADAEKGEGMLEAFGTQFMPNAYDNYEKVRAKAIEREQLLKEKFPAGEKSDTTGGDLYRKIAKATAKAVSEYDRRHDELCHFYLMHKAGIMTEAELAKLDESKICVMLPAAWAWNPPEGGATPDAPKPGDLDFARQYKPETFAAYERLKAIYDEGVEQFLHSVLDDMAVLDAVRGGGVLAPLASRLAEVSARLSRISKTLSEENLLHEVDEISAEQLADSDAKFGIEVRAFEKTLPVRDYARAWLAKNWTESEWVAVAVREAPVFGLCLGMVPIPGQNFLLGKYEVTQAQWEAVMGENPSEFKGADRPVENVSWNDCQKFITKLNALPEVKESGLVFRLPTTLEWEYACRAGAKGHFCRLSDGTEVTKETLDAVAWFRDNADDMTHPVGQKKPNAFGLYDMLGNVWEWISDTDDTDDDYDDYYRVYCGGGWNNGAFMCAAPDRRSDDPGGRLPNNLGFRLCAVKRQ